jgi:hypothetical protein
MVQSETIAQRTRMKIHFQDQDTDYYFMLALVYAGEKGSELGECFAIASQIKEKDPASWITAFTRFAERMEAQADAALQAGHSITARESYLRAFTYYRMPLIFTRPGDRHMRENYEKSRACFQRAVELLPNRIEAISVPYRHFNLPGYFMPGGTSGEKLPTLIAAYGGEIYAEELYFWCGAAGMRRGYNVLIVDLPFHLGGRLQVDQLGLSSADELFDLPLVAVTDYALTRSDVDPDKLAVVGYSAGGTYASRLAMRDKRIKALIADSPIRDMVELFTEEFPPALLKAPRFVGNAVTKLAGMGNPMSAAVFERTFWQGGINGIHEMLDGLRDTIIIPEQITCPMLCMVSEGEGEGFKRQAREVYDALRVPKTYRVLTAEEGAEAHCQLNNFRQMQAVIYDWLDETFQYRPNPATTITA